MTIDELALNDEISLRQVRAVHAEPELVAQASGPGGHARLP